MLRVAFFTDNLSLDHPIGRQAFHLAKSLAEQQCKVFVLSSEDGKTDFSSPLPKNLEIYYPFKNWGIHELPMVALFLTRLQVDVLHVFQSQRARRFWSGYPLLADLLDFQGQRPLKVFSLFDWPERPALSLQHPCATSDAITVPSTRILNQVQEIFPSKTHFVPMTAPLPIREKRREYLIEPQTKDNSLVVVPGSVSDFREPEETLLALENCLSHQNQLEVVLTGDWGDFSPFRRSKFWRKWRRLGLAPRLRLLGLKGRHLSFRVTSPRTVFWLSPLHSLNGEVLPDFHLSLDAGGWPLISSDQLELDGPEWSRLQKAVLCRSSSEDLLFHLKKVKTMTEQDLSEVTARLRRLQRSELIDQPANVIHRLYHAHLA